MNTLDDMENVLRVMVDQLRDQREPLRKRIELLTVAVCIEREIMRLRAGDLEPSIDMRWGACYDDEGAE